MTVTRPKKSVTLRLNRVRLFRWQCELAWRLAAHADIDLAVCFVSKRPLPDIFRLYITLESLIFGLKGDHACDLLSPDTLSKFSRAAHASPDVILDLSGEPPNDKASNEIRPLYDGAETDDSLIAAALENRGSEICIIDADGDVLLRGQPAIEDPRVLTRALDTAFSGLTSMCLKALVGKQERGALAKDKINSSPPMLRKQAVLLFGLRSLQAKFNNRIEELCKRAPRWFVAWRAIDPASDPTHLPDAAAYRRVADDGGRYYADPFGFEVCGQTYLFVEEFDFAMAKGLISVTLMRPDGSFGRPTPVLETSSHLSYPHVFSYAGEIWMIPESGASRSVNLYRAARFPDQWIHEATLLDNVEIGDATIFQSAGLWWMFATKRDWLGSSWDSLNVFWAERIHGPWMPHVNNPIVLDCRFARPAGNVFNYAGTLLRPAQDCSEAYGGGLAFCRIDQLDRDSVSETIQARIQLRELGLQRGPHTFNRTSAFEFIDLFGVG